MSMRGDDPKQLQAMVRELGRRASDYREYIGGHETRTRMVLIDPLLRELGWNPENPDEVQVEFKLETGKADYVLMKDGKPVAVIEAKRLGNNLGSGVHLQVLQYTQSPECSQIGLVAFTNGDDWIFCRRSHKWESLRVKISADQPFEAAYHFVECLSASRFEPEPTRNSTRLDTSIVLEVSSPATPLQEADWKQKPALLRFEDGSKRVVNSWARVYLETCRYVVYEGLVKPDDYPVVLAKGQQVKRCAMNTSKVHPNGNDFTDPREVSEGVWLENDLGSNEARKEYSVRMLRHFGIDPGSVQIEYATITIDSSKPPPMPLNKGRAR